MAKYAVAIALLAAVLSCTSGQQYISKGYMPPSLSGATTCKFSTATGNTPATCPPSTGVPLTDDGKNGSTTCVYATTGKAYEVVISLQYPAPGAVPGCTSDSQCGSNPGVICATAGPVGTPSVCFPLAPSGCPFPTADAPNSTTTATAGRKMML